MEGETVVSNTIMTAFCRRTRRQATETSWRVEPSRRKQLELRPFRPAAGYKKVLKEEFDTFFGVAGFILRPNCCTTDKFAADSSTTVSRRFYLAGTRCLFFEPTTSTAKTQASKGKFVRTQQEE